MKYGYSFLLLLLLFCCKVHTKTANQQPDPDLHLYLLVGQSNMAGRATPVGPDTVTVPNLLVFAKDKTWQPAREPLHWDKPNPGTGPGFSFGREMATLVTGKIRIGLIPAAHGGSSITSWVKGGYHDQTKGYPYDEAIDRAKAAMQTGVLKGIIWHQGESDSNPAAEQLHLVRLKDLINRFRTELDAPDLPFVAGELGYFKEPFKSMNQVLNQLPAQVPFTAVVSAAGLTHKGDNTHFDATSARELGRRYAQAMQNLQKGKSVK
ncbi:acetylxylan esterase [Adhaeribacter aerolatus]|uniref:Acetylxylan esterase n=1 Tax=Adhaeribacter aerolatus TaxID=670289 RepID=A0A512AUB1_9BACT|nr:sialate O-acetylesterase [Adhaeribacter aerolatus]GEO03302.1 acetylxylan esterase [Adhaeribacter aerolatus]